jgi:hypothetical protein
MWGLQHVKEVDVIVTDTIAGSMWGSFTTILYEKPTKSTRTILNNASSKKFYTPVLVPHR